MAVILLLVILIPQHQVKAGWLDLNIGDAVKGILTSFIGLMREFFSAAIAWAANLFDEFIQFQTSQGIYGVFVVDQSWRIIRDFVNMFFILVLIVMAFGTIFDIKNYTWRDMLPYFIISALLVNFSLTIGQYIITVANGLSSVLLKQIGAAASTTFAQGSGIVSIMAEKAAGNASLLDTYGSTIVTGIFGLTFLVIVFFAFLAAALFSLARIVILWFLLIISPIAWLGYALPNMRSRTWDKWWEQFLCWCFFLPYYIFFIMFAVIFISNKDKIPAVASAASAGGLTGNDFLFYSLSLVFLVGGLFAAKKLACASGSGVRTVFGKLEGGIKKSAGYLPGAGYVRSTAAGLKEGLAERGKEIQEKGVFGIGGAQSERLRQARVAEALGAKGAAGKAQEEAIGKEYSKLKQGNLPKDELSRKLVESKGMERIAALKLKAENGWLDASDVDEINGTMRGLGGGTTLPGASLIQSLKKGKFHEMAKSTADKEFIFNRLTDAETQKAFGLDMAESREIMTTDLATKLLDLYKGDTTETKKKVEEAVKSNIENMARDQAARKELLTGTGAFVGADDKVRKLAGQIMVDKKEINDLQSRQVIIDLIGKDTPEGREAIKNIGASNSLLNIEAKLREERGIPLDQPLSEADNKRVLDELKEKLQEKLVKNELKEIKTMSPDFFKDPRFREAAQEVFADPVDMSRLIKDSPRDMRVALKDLPGARGRRPQA